MNPNTLNELGLNSSINQNDIQLINQILSSVGAENSKKIPKMTAKERNNLISKLTSFNTLDEIPKKELKDMNEEEKKIYREELKKKLKNKQNEKKMIRTNNLSKKQVFNKTDYSNAIQKINEINNNLTNTENTNDAINNVNTEINEKNQNKLTENNLKKETLINNLINNNSEIKNESNLSENLDDFLN